jgi:hypothetical protein
MSSLDVRRLMEAAAARRARPNWVARKTLRWLVKLKVWRERVRRWGRGREEKAQDTGTPRAKVQPAAGCTTDLATPTVAGWEQDRERALAGRQAAHNASEGLPGGPGAQKMVASVLEALMQDLRRP